MKTNPSPDYSEDLTAKDLEALLATKEFCDRLCYNLECTGCTKGHIYVKLPKFAK